MRITFKLFATLSDYLPDEARQRREIELDVPHDACIDAVIDQFKLPPRLVHLVLLNGVFINHDERSKRTFRDGDTLAIWPPIAGG